jgi:flagellar basal-body rod modification protein FlgD
MQAAPVTSSTTTSPTTSSGLAPATPSKELGQDAFLQLLVTQLRNQDPLNPMDSTQFTSQLAQFASLEQLTNANKSLQNVLVAQVANTNLAATSLVGKTIKAAGDTINVKEGKVSPITYTLPQDASSVVLQAYDANGALVKTINKGAQAAGDQQAIWDGTDDQGRKVPDGTYTVKAVATGSQGESIGVTLYQTGTVTGVKYESGVAYLLLGEQKVQMGQVLQVYGPQS